MREKVGEDRREKATRGTTGGGTREGRRRAGRKPEVTREAWVEAGLAELGRNGAGALRLDTLCRRLGITKGSFYWHFENRDAFLEALLETWEKRDTLALIDFVEASGGTPRERIKNLYREANSGRVDFRIEQAIRQWGNSNREIRRMLHEVDRMRSAYMIGLFQALGANEVLAETQARLLYGLILSEAMVYRREERTERHTRQEAALQAVLSMPSSPGSTASTEMP